jgi:hypothetical protein
MTEKAVTGDSPVASESGEEGSKSSRERFAILKMIERGVKLLWLETTCSLLILLTP